jgi:hypothetical protein
VITGTVTVIVVVVPGTSSNTVLKGGTEIVVLVGSALGGRTNTHGAVHCAGVPL